MSASRVKYKKLATKYQITQDVCLIQNEECDDNICLVEYGEACSGIMKHWGSTHQIIKELRAIADALAKWSSY